MQSREFPKALESEKQLLGSMILNYKLIPNIKNIINPDDFYSDQNREIYKKILSLKYVDFETVGQAIDKNKVRESHYMALADVITSAGWKFHCNEIKKQSNKRKIWGFGTAICEESMQEHSDVDNMLSMAKNEIMSIEQDRFEEEENSNEKLYMGSYNQIHENNEPGLFTGLDGLESRFYFENEYLHCIAGESGVCKSALMLRLGDHIANTYGNVDVYSFESNKTRLSYRQIAKYSRVALSRINHNNFESDAQEEKLQKAIERLCSSRMYFWDNSKYTEIERMCAHAESRALKHNTKAIFVDYLQMSSSTNKRLDSRKSLVENALFQLKALAKNLKIPVIYLSQLRKDINGKPDLDDLYESNAIRQATDNIIFIYTPVSHDERIKNPVYPVEIYARKCKDQNLFSEWQEFNGHFQDFKWCDEPIHLLVKKTKRITL